MKFIDKLKDKAYRILMLKLMLRLIFLTCFTILLAHGAYYTCIAKDLVASTHAVSWAILCILLNKVDAFGGIIEY